MRISNLPALRIFIPFSLGIYLFLQYSYSGITILLPFLILLFIFVYYVHLSRNFLFYRAQWFGTFYHVFLLLAGYVYADLRSDKPLQAFDNTPMVFIADVVDAPEEKENSYKSVLKVVGHLQPDSVLLEKPYKVLAYFAKNNDSDSRLPNIGDRLVVRASLGLVKNGGNPDEFDYKQFLHYRGINYQTFIQSGNYYVYEPDRGIWYRNLAHNLRSSLLNVYKEYGLTGDNFGVLAALTLGYKAELAEEIRDAYAASGAMHVLAVSGLHVGIIYAIFLGLFRRIRKTRSGRIVSTLFIVTFLWIFAFITGLSPSVNRASLMFSFMAIAQIFDRRLNIYNTLASSAFFLLLINPFYLKSVGFQLSYLAVLSIVSLQPLLYKKLQFKNKLLSWAWGLITVSVAAQIGTAPIGLLYFHQFPNYFLLTNFVVIPAASIVIYLALILFIFSTFSTFLATYAALLLKYFMSLLNHAIQGISEMPGAVARNISFSMPDMLFSYIFMVLLVIWLVKKHRKYLYRLALVSIIYLSISAGGRILRHHHDFFIVYNASKSSLYSFKLGKQHLSYANLEADDRSIEFAAMGHWLTKKMHIPELQSVNQLTQNAVNSGIVKWGDYKICFVDNSFIEFTTQEKLKVDILVLSDNTRLSIRDMQNLFEFDKIVIDSSAPSRKYRSWINDCSVLKIDCHHVVSDGAFFLSPKAGLSDLFARVLY